VGFGKSPGFFVSKRVGTQLRRPQFQGMQIAELAGAYKRRIIVGLIAQTVSRARKARQPRGLIQSVIMSPLRRHIFVCFMAKSAFWGVFGPSSVKRGRTHIVLG